jgi:hypothetical protein
MYQYYTKMWQNLGLDLEKHDNLLKVLSDLYQQIYLTQSNRPEGMKYFDFFIPNRICVGLWAGAQI